MEGKIPVEFAPDVESELSQDLQDILRRELSDVFQKSSAPKFGPEKLRVSRCFGGYSPDTKDEICQFC